MRESAGREVGSYPETAIVVSLLDSDSGAVEERRYPLWGENLRVPIGTVLPPDNIAGEIWVMVTQPDVAPNDRLREGSDPSGPCWSGMLAEMER
jgi:hypothetical protein